MSNDAERLEVQCIRWPDRPDEEGARTRATDTKRLVYENRYHGDRNEEWILVFENGIEVRRHNVRFLDTIIWKEPKAE